MRTRPAVLAIAAAMLLALLGAAASANTTGGVSPQPAGCLSAAAASGCTTLHDAQFPWKVAITPDGRHVYAGDFYAHHILVLDRNPVTGTIAQKPGLGGCVAPTATATCSGATGLGTLADVAVSPDGKHLYAASNDMDTVVVFDIGSTGTLTRSSCVSNGFVASCTDVRAMDYPEDVAVSPDGKNVYVASSDSDSVAVFSRDSATGALTQLAGGPGCLQYSLGADACTTDSRLDGARSISITSDGTVVVGSYASSAVIWYSRGSSGQLTPVACAAGSVVAGCTLVGQVTYAYSVLARGTRVYVGASDRLVILERVSGAPTYKGCLGGSGCSAARGISSGLSLAADAQGTHVFGLFPSPDHGTVTAFRSTPTGLSQVSGPGGCRYSGPVPLAGCAPIPAANYPYDGVVSPDGRFLLVAAGESVTSLRIDTRAPVCATRSARIGKNNPTNIRLVCRDADGDPMVVSIVAQPGRGSLGAVNQATDTVRYTPPKGYLGRTSFRYRAVSTNGVVGTSGTISVAVAGCAGHASEPGRHWLGTAGNDRIVGGAGRDVICGGGGKDLLIGKAGRDLLLGGAGKDRCLGGPGADRLRSCERRR